MKILRLSFIILLLYSSYVFARDIPRDPHALAPPAAVAPQFDYPAWTGNDAWSSTGPTGAMDVMTTQSTGTYWGTQPESHPIPLSEIRRVERQ